MHATLSVRAASRGLIACGAILWVGCGWLSRQPAEGEPTPDAGGPTDGGTSRPPERDGGTVSDGGTASTRDGGDAAAERCSDLPPPEPTSCSSPVCEEGGSWTLVLHPEGTFCDERRTQRCVDDVCVWRGCGDGFREPFAEGTLREGCDDGNVTSGDGCSAECVPEPRTVSPADERRHHTPPSTPALAADGDGSLLLVWTSADVRGEASVLARRIDRRGRWIDAEEDVPLVIADAVGELAAQPSVAGLPGGGWVVVWVSLDDDGVWGVRYRLLRPDGHLSLPQAVSEWAGLAVVARVVVIDIGFVVVWEDRTGSLAAPGPTVFARIFRESGLPEGASFPIPTAVGVEEVRPAVASGGGLWVVGWEEVKRVAPRHRHLYFRAFRRGEAIDTAPRRLTTQKDASTVSVSTLESGDFVFVWTASHAVTGRNDVFGRRLVVGTASELELDGVTDFSTTADVEDAFPAVASLRGDDYLVTWLVDTGGFADAAGVHAERGAAMPAEGEDLEDLLSTDVLGPPSLSPTPDAIWVTWPRRVDGQPRLSLYRLPVD